MIPVSIAKAVTTAGTRVPLSATSLMVTRFTVQALFGNTGRIYVGGSTVASTNGISLDAKQMLAVDPQKKGPSEKTDLANWYIDSSVNLEGVSIMYFIEE